MELKEAKRLIAARREDYLDDPCMAKDAWDGLTVRRSRVNAPWLYYEAVSDIEASFMEADGLTEEGRELLEAVQAVARNDLRILVTWGVSDRADRIGAEIAENARL